MKEKELRRKYLEFQILTQKINQIQKQINSISEGILELNSLKLNLDYIKTVEKDKEVWIPIGSSIFVKGSLKNTPDVMMGVGSDIMVEKTIEQSKDSVNEQIKELEKVSLDLEKNFSVNIEKLEKLEKELIDLQKGEK